MKHFLLCLGVLLTPIFVSAQSFSSNSSIYCLPGDTLTINGSGFNSVDSQVSLSLGQVKVQLVQAETNLIKFIVPNGTFSGKLIYTDKFNKKSISSRFDVFIRNRAKASMDFKYIYANSEQLDIENTYNGLEYSWFYDLDGDGKVEILSVTDNAAGIYAYETSIFAEKLKFGTSTRLAEVLDLNMDGKPDLLLDSLHQKRAYLNRSSVGDIKFEFADTFNYSFNLLPSSRSNIGLQDFNGDGRADLLNTKLVLNSDSNIVLNLANSGVGFKFKKRTAATLARALNASEGALTVVDLNDDNLSDLIHSYRDTVLNKDIIQFLVNTSALDTIRFLAVDTLHNVKLDTFRYSNYCDRVDINGDGIKEWVFTNMKLSTSGENDYGLVMSKDINYKFSIYPKTGSAKSSKVNFLIDYNFDSIPEYLTVNNDTVYHLKMQLLNDTVSVQQKMLISNVSDVLDLNHDNILDLVNFRSSMPVVCLGRTYSYQVYNPDIVNAAFDSLELIKDSIKIKVSALEQVEIDSIRSRRSIVFYKDNSYSTALSTPLLFGKSTDLVLYYSYTFNNDQLDTFSMKFAGQKVDFAYLQIKKREKHAVIKSISTRFAVPGDTITLKGKHLFKELNHVSIRLSNRKCKILNTSSDTLIRFIYPSMTGKSRLVLIDTFRKKQHTTQFVVTPKNGADVLSDIDSTYFDSELPSYYKSETVSHLGTYYSEFELPGDVGTGHLFMSNSCLFDTLDEKYMPFGTFRFNTSTPSNFRPLQLKSDFELTEKFYSIQNNDHLLDLDGNGLFDNPYLMDSLKTYFCTSAGDNELNYELRFLSPPQFWAYEFSLEYDWFADMVELNNDGKLDFLIYSTNDPNKCYVFNLNQSASGFDLIDSANIVNRDKWSFYGFEDIDDDGFKDQVFMNYDDSLIYLYYNKNLSKYGDYQFSNDTRLIATYSFKNFNNYIKFDDIDNDGKVELMTFGTDGSVGTKMSIFTKDRIGSTNFSFLDTFRYDGYFFSLRDVDNDGKSEVLANKIYKVELGKDSITSREINTGNAYKGVYTNTLLMDFNDDQLVDLFDGSKVNYNRGHLLKLGHTNKVEFTVDSFNQTVAKSVWLYNLGNQHLQIDTILLGDSNYSCTINDTLMSGVGAKINRGDSLLLTITFNPTNNTRKQFNCKPMIKFENSKFFSVFEIKGVVRQPAIIESIVPSIYFAGDTLLLKGRYLNCYRQPIIYFDETKAEVLSFNDTMLLLIAPAGNNLGKITLWDTFANLYSVSPFPTNYAFVGSKNALNNSSFEVIKLSTRNYSAKFLDVDRDGLTDWTYLNGGTTGYVKNQSNADSIQLQNIPIPNLGTLPYNGREAIPGFSTNGLHSTSYFNSFNGIDYDIGINNQYVIYSEASTTSYTPLSSRFLNDIDGNGYPELNIKLMAKSTLFIELERFYEEVGCGNLYEQLKYRSIESNVLGGGGIETYDFDGDGKAELFYQDTVFKITFNASTKDSIMVAATYRFNETIDGNYKVKDLNLDGKLDIIANRRLFGNVNEIVTFRNTSTKGNLSFVTSLDTLPVELSYANFEITDFNGDLLPDLALVGGYFVYDTIDFYTNLSDANNIRFGANARFRVPGEELLSKQTDFNGDGKTDLMISTDSGIYVMINKSISGFLSRTKYNGTSLFGTPLSLDLVIYSDGGDTLKIDRINLPPGFSLSNSSGLLRFGLGAGISFPILIAPGDSFVLQLENDSLLAPGQYSNNVEFFNNARNKPFVLSINRVILANPLAEVNTTAINFGEKEYLSAVIDSVLLKSVGTDTLRVNSIQLSDTSNFQLVSVTPDKLAPKDSVWIKVKFLSKKIGNQTEYLYIKHNAFDSIAGVVLEAKTVRPLLPDSIVIDFDTARVGSKKTVYIELINKGTDSLNLNSPIAYTGTAFNLSQVDLARTFVKPGDSIKLKVEFDAKQMGTFNEVFRFTYVSGSFESKFVFKGFGRISMFQSNGNQVVLGNIRKSVKRSFRIPFSNAGNQALVLQSVSSSNPAIKASICNLKDTIQPSDGSELCIEIDPKMKGAIIDSVKVICNDADSVHYIGIRAMVIAAEPVLVGQPDTIKEYVGQYDRTLLSIRNDGNDTMFNVNCTFVGVPYLNVTLQGNQSATILPGAQQILEVNFHPLSRINQSQKLLITGLYDTTLSAKNTQFVSYEGELGEIDRNVFFAAVNKVKDTVVRIKNTGNAKFVLSSISNLNTQVTYTPLTNEVLPGADLLLNIKITPVLYNNEIKDTLKLMAIVDSVNIKRNYPISIYISYPVIEVSSSTIDFGTVAKGTESIRNLEIKNVGNDTMFYKLKLPSGFESNQANDTKLLTGQSKNIQIKFKPNRLGVYADGIDVISNSSIKHKIISISGLSILSADSVILTSVPLVDFGKVRINDSLSKVVELKNEGSDSLTVRVQLSDQAFKLLSPKNFNLLSGESKNISVEFLPKLDVAYTGKIIVTNLYGDTLKMMDLLGKGHTTSVSSQMIEEVSVYPNPADQYVTMYTSTMPVSITAFDQNGRSISADYEMKQNSVIVDTQNWSNGVYLLNVVTDKGQFTVKVVVMHN